MDEYSGPPHKGFESPFLCFSWFFQCENVGGDTPKISEMVITH